MSSKNDDSSPAFPIAHQLLDANHPHFKLGYKGMSLRDWFAGMALQALNQQRYEPGVGFTADAQAAYAMADAMIQERNK